MVKPFRESQLPTDPSKAENILTNTPIIEPCGRHILVIVGSGINLYFQKWQA
jgi:hypothetical protein